MNWKKVTAAGLLLAGGAFVGLFLLGVIVGSEEGLNAVPDWVFLLGGLLMVFGGGGIVIGCFGWCWETLTKKEGK